MRDVREPNLIQLLTLYRLGSVSDLTLGGVISTATHGTGVKHRVIAGYVTEIELLTSSGDIVKCSKEEKTEIYYSVLSGLGAIGIIINVTLQCESAFYLLQQQSPATLDEVICLDMFSILSLLHNYLFYG